MSEKIDKIKDILDQLDEELEKQNNTISNDFSFFELPEIVSNIIEYLQPLLFPYEMAIYWYMFNNSVLKKETNLIRVSTRGLGKPKTVVTSSSGQSEGLSYGSVQDALAGLEKKGAIRKAGDTNREGTLYQIFLPDEILICKEYMQEKAVTEPISINDKKEVDYYNIKENRYKIFERDGYKCHYCRKLLTRFSATLDHIQPVSKGGDNSYENLITSCLNCNSNRTDNEVMEAVIRGNKIKDKNSI
ncbi:MAG: HNH endonuclease signature motif containing protein [Candidatus Latescibacterota bacterium]